MSPANTTPPAVGVTPLITGKRVLNFQDVAPLCCGRTRSAAHWAAEFTYKVNGVQRVAVAAGMTSPIRPTEKTTAKIMVLGVAP